VFQSYALYPHMTVRENMSFGLEESTDLGDDEINQRVEDAATTMGIDDLIDRRPGELSGGQQQRVALGRSIVRDPSVFLLDEPLSNLDAKLRSQMRTELQRIQEDLGVTTVYVTHDQTEAMTMGDRIAILDGGQLQQVGTPLECYHEPANQFVAGFIGEPSMNFFETTVEDGRLVGVARSVRESQGDSRSPSEALRASEDASGCSSGRSPREDDEDVALHAVEAGGSSLAVDEERGVAPNSASLSTGEEGVLHGARTRLLQDDDGQILESHSVSAGLDYAGVGPELAHLVESGRVRAVNVDDDAALAAFHRLSNMEGIIPALESAHALAYLDEAHDGLGDTVIVNVSGRGDKDLETVIEETDRREIDEAPEMDVFAEGL